MTTEDELRDKLRKIEALFAGAKTDGEREAAGAAAERIRARLGEAATREAAVEMRFAIHDPWSRKLFLALSRRYGIEPYRYPRMKRQSLVVRAPASFVEGVLWPEFTALNEALSSYLLQVTERVIRDTVHADTGEATERAEPRSIE
ncbi:MAG: hypothetical protein SFW09_22895 [Hyphomicrobiaceae bacterium]|nr:hypothetical protein [Hyphomicrobiaceae bacterium]